MSEICIHPIPPFVPENAEVLILGSFPSVKSREIGFFYGHPQNRFYRVLAELYCDATPETVEEKKDFLARHRIALWDVIASCRIEGSQDGSVREVRPNDLRGILKKHPDLRIFTNGKTAARYYRLYIEPQIGVKAGCLPSTSPANAAFSLARLVEEWRIVL